MTHVQAHVSRSTAVAALLQAPAGRTRTLCALLPAPADPCDPGGGKRPTAYRCLVPPERVMRARKTQRSDASDSRAKRAFLREQAARSPALALKIAQAIQADPALLDGNASVVACLARHERAAALLAQLFARHGKRYPKTHRAFIEVRFALMTGK